MLLANLIIGGFVFCGLTLAIKTSKAIFFETFKNDLIELLFDI